MATDTPWSEAEKNAVARLEQSVEALARQWSWQQLTRFLADALFWGMLVSSLVVLALRLSGYSESLTAASTVIIVIALSVATFLAWRLKPSTLAAAIKADEQLGFKQSLSTAWEFRQSQPTAPVTANLALQALGRRLATVSGVFPLELNLTGMLVPFAGALLLLSSSIELEDQASKPTTEIDTVLVQEGTRLKEFAERMKLRADRERFAKSQREAASIQQLGTEMQTGVMQREQALKRLAALDRSLSSQRAASLQEITRGRRGSINSNSSETISDAVSTDTQDSGDSISIDSQSANILDQIQRLGLPSLKDKLSTGDLSTADLEALERAAEALRELGSDSAEWSEELAQALDQYTEGDSSELREVLESLIESEQHLREAEDLEGAREAVSRASENLGGESLFEANRVRISQTSANEADGASAWLKLEKQESFLEAQLMAGGSVGRSQSNFSVNREPGRSAQLPSGESNITLKPQSKTNEGGSFRSETWALPKVGNVAVENLEVDTRFQQQLEAVQAKENYPLHRKEYLRRYFLNLSTVVDSSDNTEK